MEQGQKKNTAIDITADYLYPRLTPLNVADLVLLTMVKILFFLLAVSYFVSLVSVFV